MSLFLIVRDLARVALECRAQEEFAIADAAHFPHFAILLHRIYRHVLLLQDQVCLVGEQPHLIRALLACFVAAELAMINFAAPQLCITDHAQSILDEVVSAGLLELENLLVQLEVDLLVTHVNGEIVPPSRALEVDSVVLGREEPTHHDASVERHALAIQVVF